MSAPPGHGGPRTRTSARTARGRVARVVAVVIAAALALSGPAVAGDPGLLPGSREVTLAGGPLVSYGIGAERETLTGFHLVPHLGLVLTGERGEGALRGQVALLIEPTLVHVESDEPTDLLGLAVAGRWIFHGWGRTRPYVEAGAGVVTGQAHLPRNECEILFPLQVGAGLLWLYGERHALTIGLRQHHLSNADLCTPNQGLNAAVLLLGVTTFFD